MSPREALDLSQTRQDTETFNEGSLAKLDATTTPEQLAEKQNSDPSPEPMSLWLLDFELNKSYFTTNRDFMKLLKQRALGQFDKARPAITSFKDFKVVMRQLSLVPTYTSEYKAQHIYKFILDKYRKTQLDATMLVACIYLIFSLFVQPHEIITQSQRFSAGAKPEDKALQTRMREAFVQMSTQASWPQEFFQEEHADLRTSLRKKKSRYIVDYVGSYIKVAEFAK